MGRTPRSLLLAAFASGSSSLMYELLWTRALARQFGTTLPAVTTVVAAFMGGMTLGALWFGARADREADPLRLYQRIEFALAGLGLALSWFLLRGESWLGACARLLEQSGALAGTLRAALFGLLLLGPSTLVGATLIVLTRALLQQGHSGRALGSLYAVNTAGALLGSVLPDFVLVPRIGLTATALLASLGNCAAALLANRARATANIPVTPALPTEASVSTGHNARVVAISCVSGFCALAAEVLWSRSLQHWSVALVTSFGVLLAAYLGCVALGTVCTHRWADRVQDPASVAACALGLLGPCLLLPIAFAPEWRALQRAWLPRPVELLRSSLGYEALNALSHALYLEAPACLLMGAAFPFLAAAYVRIGHAGRQTGLLYAANTCAGVFGSICAGFFWLPQLGSRSAYCAIAMLAAASCSVLCWTQRGRTRLVALCGLLATLGLVASMPQDVLQRANFRGGGHVLELIEGSTTSAAFAQRYRFGLPHHSELLTPGVSMSETSFGARRYMALFAHLGAFFNPQPRRALLVCYGVGNTAQALLAQPELEHLDVVDLAAEVLALSPHFARERGNDPLRDPRTRVFVDDGRHHLLVRDNRYDLITSEPPPPNDAGVVNLYSREYYRIAKQRLAPGGVLTQWLPVFQLSSDDARTMIAAFTAEFAHSALFYGFEHQWILVGSQTPLRIDHTRWQARAAQPSIAQNLSSVGIESIYALYAALLLDDSELRALVRGSAALSDDLPSIEYPRQSLRQAFMPGRPTRSEPRATALLTSPLSATDNQQLTAASAVMDHVFERLHHSEQLPSERWEALFAGALGPLAQHAADREGVFGLLGIDRADVALAKRRVALEADLAQALSTDPGSLAHSALFDAVIALARRALYMGQPTAAAKLLESIPHAQRGAREEWLRGRAAQQLGQMVAAHAAWERALRLSTDGVFSSDLRARIAAQTALLRR